MNQYDPYNQVQQGAAHNPYDAYNEPYKSYTEPTFPQQGATQFQVEKVIFVPTGTYNQQWRRPWVTNYNVQNATAVHDVIGAAYRDHQLAKANGTIHAETPYAVDPLSLAGVSASFIQPAAQGEVQAYGNIQGGWQEQHGRFMMSLLVKRHQSVMPVRYILVGYTNYVGFTQQQHVDPNMELNINAIFEVRDIEVDRGFGKQYEQRLVAVNQILVDHNFNGPQDADIIRLRPYEVATSLARMNDPMLQAQGVVAVDTRDIQNGTPQFSNQHHTNPNDYMAQVLTGLVGGRDLSRQTNRSGVIEPYHMAARQLRDASASQDPFIQAISRAGGNGTISSTFRWRDMLQIDPRSDADGVCFIQWRDRLQYAGSVGENMHQAGTTSEWNGQDLATQVAVQIANMVPSMMVDHALRKVDIVASNVQGHPISLATNGIGIVNGVDLSPQMVALGTLFHQQCAMPCTFNGGILYNMTISVDLFGETVIRLKLENQPEYTYVQPTYCSSVMSPVLTSRRDTLDNLATAFQTLQKEVLPTTPVRPLIHDMAYGTAGTTTGKKY